MNYTFPPIIQAKNLLSLSQADSIVLVDAGNGVASKNSYLERHLKGAVFVDLNQQLADIKEDLSDGGRHPLPTVEAFSRTLMELGISPASHVVIYDNKHIAYAAVRFWWMLRAVGHKKVQVLDGGFTAAEKVGFPMGSGEEKVKTDVPYEIRDWKLPIANISEVEKASASSEYLVIDVRENKRFKGIKEPIDLIPGHIPGAVNIPFSTNLDQNGLFLSPSELKLKYQNILADKDKENTIVHCGSGVTACHTLLAIDYAGLPLPKLYVGSWSEWSRNGKTIATEE